MSYLYRWLVPDAALRPVGFVDRPWRVTNGIVRVDASGHLAAAWWPPLERSPGAARR